MDKIRYFLSKGNEVRIVTKLATRENKIHAEHHFQVIKHLCDNKLNDIAMAKERKYKINQNYNKS
ncbi:unnamed protein product [Cunninghamella echinulata]